jgi:hypothetical protein
MRIGFLGLGKMRNANGMKWLCWIAAAPMAGGMASGVTCRAQQAAPQVHSARAACRLVQTMLPLADELEDTRSVRKIAAIQLTPSGFSVILADKKTDSLEYADSPGAKPYGTARSYQIDFLPSRTFRVQRGFLLDFHGKNPGAAGFSPLVEALNFLIASARRGEPIDCTEIVDEQAALDRFAQLTADWRAREDKPPLPESVIEQRAQAEDALERRDTTGALAAYIAGVTIDPTWAQGWRRAAALYAEQENYDDAAFSMKHYLILLPGAPDAADAKQNLSAWEAKAREGPAAETVRQGAAAK